jgi:hypothetical protein
MRKNGEMLQEKLTDALKTGEIPYQAAHSAAKSIDWYDDDRQGQKDLNLTVAGLKLFIDDLGDFESVAKAVQRKAIAAVR